MSKLGLRKPGHWPNARVLLAQRLRRLESAGDPTTADLNPVSEGNKHLIAVCYEHGLSSNVAGGEP